MATPETFLLAACDEATTRLRAEFFRPGDRLIARDEGGASTGVVQGHWHSGELLVRWGGSDHNNIIDPADSRIDVRLWPSRAHEARLREQQQADGGGA